MRPVRRPAERGQLLRDAGRQVLLRNVPGRGADGVADRVADDDDAVATAATVVVVVIAGR